MTLSPSFSISLITIPPIVIGLFYFLFYKPMQYKIRSLEKSKNYSDSTYLRKQGGTSTYGGGELGKDFINYDLRSWDAGKNWYAVTFFWQIPVKLMIVERINRLPVKSESAKIQDSRSAH